MDFSSVRKVVSSSTQNQSSGRTFASGSNAHSRPGNNVDRFGGARKLPEQQHQLGYGPVNVVSSYHDRRARGNDSATAVLRRRPGHSILPTPKKIKPSPTKALSVSNRAPEFSSNSKTRTNTIGVNNIRRGMPRASQAQEQSREGVWLDSSGRIRRADSPDSESDSSMDIDHPSPANSSSMEPLSSASGPSAKKTEVISSEDNDDMDVSIHQNAKKTTVPRPIRPIGTKTVIISDDDDEEEEEELEEEEEGEGEGEGERQSKALSVPMDSDSDIESAGDNIGYTETESIPAPSAILSQAIKPFLPILPSPTRKLPFLRRNLRMVLKSSFANCPGTEIVSIQVLLRTGFEDSRWSFTIDSWSCPLCQLFNKLNSKSVLEEHLEWSHPEVRILWLRVEPGRVKGQEHPHQWRLILTFPKPLNAKISPHFRYASVKAAAADVSKETLDIGNIGLTSLTMDDDSDVETVESHKSLVAAALNAPVRSPAIVPPSSTSPSRGRSTTLATAPVTPGCDPRYPTPPPENNPRGPAARYPYLPATSDDGKIVIKYSCRPGGPYLYDLLGLLPLDEFGVLSWAVLDREAEIFESDDISDEYKVMHALWGRWIMLNRRAFIQDYFAGVMRFIDQYWLMIHRAAGWDALRYWLLLLMVNKFLDAQKVAQLITYYEDKTGMKYWADQ